MTRNWTKEQLEAIEKEGTNIIVSAGAGSGKTAVLTQRVIRKLSQGVNVDKLLVLTFTKAASHEMKERIRSRLKDDIKLQKQLALLDASYITTFDSFALSIVKKYHYILNVSPNVSICDASILKMEKAKIIDNIFDDLYKINDPGFLKLIGDFCVKDDKNIKNYILKINDKLDMKYDRDEYLDNYLNSQFSEDNIDRDIDSFTNIIKDRINHIQSLMNKISKLVDYEYYTTLELSLTLLLDSKTYDDYKNHLNIDLPKLSKNDDGNAKKYRDDINDIIKELNNICVWNNIDEIKQSILMTKDYITIIISIIKDLNQKLKVYKFDHDLYEFVDIANMSIKLVENNNDIREELKNNFNEILVDEYQDTNDLQEHFISLIENNNVYMVGDIKQSIYRFRNANPNIFKHKYEMYKSNHNGQKIDLNKNFRSRFEVLNNINLIFDDIMSLDFGGADYRNSHRLEYGNLSFDNIGKTNQNNNLEIYNYQFSEYLNFKREEIEAFLIADDIKRKIDNHYQVMDSEKNELRAATYSDFAILLDRGTNFDLYKKIFTFLKIPLVIYRDEVITASSDILVIKSLLKLILYIRNNKYDNDFKYAFMSVGRSFLFDYSDDELFSLLADDNYYKTELFQMASVISNKIDNNRIDIILKMVVKNFKIIESLVKIGNVNDMINRIEYLIDNAISLSNMGYTLEAFINYLDEGFNDKSDIKLSLNNDDSKACHIMTIHKSKGLEYNICYYAGLYAEFNISDLKELFYYDSTYSLIVPYLDEGICNTIYKTLLKEKYIKEEIEEKIRLFYVALTRCKEKMIVIADLNSKEEYDKEDNGLVSLSSRLKYRSFKDILWSVNEKLQPYIKDIEIDEHLLTHDYNFWNVINYTKRIPDSATEIIKDSIHIESNEVLEESYSKKINELINSQTHDVIELGKKIHYYLEIIDFNNVDLSIIDDQYHNMIISFFKQPFMKDVGQAKVYKEYEFIYNDRNVEHHGIIDLMLEFRDHIKIIDYKLKYISGEAYDQQLLGYKKYIENISHKRVELYLYSIIDEEYRVVEYNSALN